MGYRDLIQEDEAELPAPLLLWWEWECDLHSSLVHIDSPVVIDSYTENSTGEESLFSSSLIGSDTLDKYAGCQWTAQEHKKDL